MHFQCGLRGAGLPCACLWLLAAARRSRPAADLLSCRDKKVGKEALSELSYITERCNTNETAASPAWRARTYRHVTGVIGHRDPSNTADGPETSRPARGSPPSPLPRWRHATVQQGGTATRVAVTDPVGLFEPAGRARRSAGVLDKHSAVVAQFGRRFFAYFLVATRK